MRHVKKRIKNNVKVCNIDAAVFFIPTLIGPLRKDDLPGQRVP